jgi:Cu+-exporting ATPase
MVHGEPTNHELITNNALRLAASLEKSSEHSLAEAIVKAAEEKKLVLSNVEGFQAIPGYGVEGMIEGKRVLLGNRRLMEKEHIALGTASADMEQLEQQGKTVMMLALSLDNTRDKLAQGVTGNLVALIAVADTLKETALKAVHQLQALGIEVVMITGDNARTAHAIAGKLGITKVLAEVLPQEKANMVKELQNSNLSLRAPIRQSAERGVAISGAPDLASSPPLADSSQ